MMPRGGLAVVHKREIRIAGFSLFMATESSHNILSIVYNFIEKKFQGPVSFAGITPDPVFCCLLSVFQQTPFQSSTG